MDGNQNLSYSLLLNILTSLKYFLECNSNFFKSIEIGGEFLITNFIKMNGNSSHLKGTNKILNK